jgi:hypothetical protein
MDCLFDADGCVGELDTNFTATAVELNELFDNLTMRNVEEGDTMLEVTVSDELATGETYSQMFIFEFKGVKSPTKLGLQEPQAQV